MPDAFELQMHPAMRFGPGAADATGRAVSDLTGAAVPVLLVADPVLESFGVTARVRASLERDGHAVSTFSDLASDPKESAVDVACAQLESVGAAAVVGLGGGSAMDTAKLVAAIAGHGRPAADYALSATPYAYRRTALVCVPTTAGTGAETTPTSIVSRDADGVKNWFWGPALKPDTAILDPELTRALPPFWTFFTGFDALVHAMESRTNRYSYPANDAIAEEAIELAIGHLARATTDGDDMEARGAMLLAAAKAGLAISNTGCAAGHNVGHALGSMAGVPHGRAVAIAFVATLPWTMQANRAAFDRVGVLLGGEGAEDIAPILSELARGCGQSLSLTPDERASIDAARLADDLTAPANVSMLDACARDRSDGTGRELVSLTLAA